MRNFQKLYKSKYKYWVVGYIFLGLGLYGLLLGEKAYYETLSIVALYN
jgi:hypothetical protein